MAYNIYERDYTLGLTADEEAEYEAITGHKFNGEHRSGLGTVNNPSKYPKAVRLCRTLFPNNFLDFLFMR